MTVAMAFGLARLVFASPIRGRGGMPSGSFGLPERGAVENMGCSLEWLWQMGMPWVNPRVALEMQISRENGAKSKGSTPAVVPGAALP